MATIEKLIVQIFDKKRQIIEQLRHKKLQYDQHLTSKLLLRGIPPPPWLLSSDLPSTSSDLIVDKEELISGLLFPRPGPIASYTSGPCFLYDNPAVHVANNGMPDQECDKRASSNGCDQDISLSLHHTNDSEDGIGIIPLPRVDFIADTLNYAPLSPDDQNYARISDADPMSERSLIKLQRSRSGQKALEPAPNDGMPFVSSTGCHENGSASLHHVNDSETRASIIFLPHVDVPGKTLSYSRMSSEDQDYARISDVDPMSEQSQVKIQRSRSQQKALEPVPNDGMPDQECEKCASSNSCYQDKSVSLHHVDDSEDGVDIKPLPHVDLITDTLIYAPMSPEDQNYSRLSDSNPRPELSLVKIQRSRSRQKALEIRSSAKGSRKQSLGIYTEFGVPSGSKTSSDVDHVDSLTKDGVLMGNHLDKVKNSDACGSLLASSAENEAEEVQIGGKSKTQKRSSAYVGRVPRSRSCGQDSLCISSGIKICRYEEHVGSKESFQLVQPSEFSSEICSKNEGGVRATIFRSGATTETGDHRSRSDNDVSVKPKQLDFDEVTESLSVDNPIVFGIRSNHALRQRMDGIDGSWPRCKRRKIDYHNSNKSAFPSLGLKPINASRQDFRNTFVRGDKNDSGTLENIESSHYSDAKLSDSEILAKEADQRLNYLLNKGVESTPDIEMCLPLPQNLIHTSGVKSANCGDLAEQTVHRCCITDLDTNLSSSKYISPTNCSLHDSDAMLSNCEIFPDRIRLSINCSLDKRVQAASGNVEVGPGFQDSTISLSSDGMLFDREIPYKEMDQTASHVLNRESEPLHQEAGDKYKVSLASPLIERMNVTEADQAMPEFEGFGAQDFGDELTYKEIPLLSNTKNRTSLPGICRSASSSTPISPYPAPCKWYLNPNLYSSVPNGLLENMDLGSNLLLEESVLLGKSHSDLFSFPGIQSGWDVRRPFLSPVGKGFESITLKSGGSDKVGSGNPELACFTILEDPESCEEDLNDVAEANMMETYSSKKSYPIKDPLSEDLNEMAEVSLAETDSSKKSSSIREPLCDITQQNESTLGPNSEDLNEMTEVSVVETDSSKKSSSIREPLCDITQQNESTLGPNCVVERSSSESVSTEIGVSETHNIDSKVNVMKFRRSGRTVHGKENKGLSVGGNSPTKHSKTLSSRFSKPKLSGKSSLRSRGQSMSEKEPKRNNIVSNVKSFVPLVQQKQAAAAVTVKRDVKVKALEAAEAAKRLAEKKENERKQKKEALKLERAKLEQDNLKQMELARKLKEEAKKKREADNAARKRHREEEERKGKERKRARLEEARFQQKQADEKIHAWREESRCGVEEEKARERKDNKMKTQNEVDRPNEGNISKSSVKDLALEWDDRTGVGAELPTLNDHKSSTEFSDIETVGRIIISESSTPTFDKNDKSSDRTSREQSYDISPYQCSDDEGDEEDEIPNKKFIPTWASKTCVALTLPSQRHLDPDTIFPPGSFCSLDEVLMPRRLSQK